MYMHPLFVVLCICHLSITSIWRSKSFEEYFKKKEEEEEEEKAPEKKKEKKKKEEKEKKKEVPPRFELGLLDSKSKVLTVTPRNRRWWKRNSNLLFKSPLKKYSVQLFFSVLLVCLHVACGFKKYQKLKT